MLIKRYIIEAKMTQQTTHINETYKWNIYYIIWHEHMTHVWHKQETIIEHIWHKHMTHKWHNKQNMIDTNTWHMYESNN